LERLNASVVWGAEYTKYLYLHGLSVETAEALAKLHHKKMPEELGIAREDARRYGICFIRSIAGRAIRLDLQRVRTWRIRPSCLRCFGQKNVGVRLTSGFLHEPEQSTSAILVHHPGATYFVV